MATDLLQRETGVNGDGMCRYRFNFAPLGNVTTAIKANGKYIQSIVRTGTGLYLVTFVAQFAAILRFTAGIRETAAGPLNVCDVMLDPVNTVLTAASPATAGSVVALQLVTKSTGAATDFTSTTTGAGIDVEIVFATDPNNKV